MREEDLGLGVKLIYPDKFEDWRGALTTRSLESIWVSELEVFTRDRATLRGLHYQTWPHSQAKLMRVVKGWIFDVAVRIEDLQAVSVPLGPGPSLLIPHGFAHGYVTETDDVIVTYKVDNPWHPDAERGLRWNDPALKIAWPCDHPRMNHRDESWPLTNGRSPAVREEGPASQTLVPGLAP